MSRALRIGVYARSTCDGFAGVDAEIRRLGTLIEVALPSAPELVAYPDICQRDDDSPGPALQKLLADVRAGEIGAVLVRNVGAFGNSAKRIVAAFRAAGAEMITEADARRRLAARRASMEGAT